MFNLITGVHPLTGGEIDFQDRRIDRLKSYRDCQLGISRTFQTVELFGNMTVLENVMVGCHPWTKAGHSGVGTPLAEDEKGGGLDLEESLKKLDLAGSAGKSPPALDQPAPGGAKDFGSPAGPGHPAETDPAR